MVSVSGSPSFRGSCRVAKLALTRSALIFQLHGVGVRRDASSAAARTTGFLPYVCCFESEDKTSLLEKMRASASVRASCRWALLLRGLEPRPEARQKRALPSAGEAMGHVQNLLDNRSQLISWPLMSVCEDTSASSSQSAQQGTKPQSL